MPAPHQRQRKAVLEVDRGDPVADLRSFIEAPDGVRASGTEAEASHRLEELAGLATQFEELGAAPVTVAGAIGEACGHDMVGEAEERERAVYAQPCLGAHQPALQIVGQAAVREIDEGQEPALGTDGARVGAGGGQSEGQGAFQVDDVGIGELEAGAVGGKAEPLHLDGGGDGERTAGAGAKEPRRQSRLAVALEDGHGLVVHKSAPAIPPLRHAQFQDRVAQAAVTIGRRTFQVRRASPPAGEGRVAMATQVIGPEGGGADEHVQLWVAAKRDDGEPGVWPQRGER